MLTIGNSQAMDASYVAHQDSDARYAIQLIPIALAFLTAGGKPNSCTCVTVTVWNQRVY